MKKQTLFILILTISFLSVLQLIGSTKYMSLVDAGSSGSRVFLYKLTVDKDKFVEIVDIPISHNKTHVGIEAFVDRPKDGFEGLSVILDNLKHTIKESNIEGNIDFYLFATAGMRTKSRAKQYAFYKKLKELITKNYSFLNPKILRTVPGKLEGTFDWITINYMKKTLFSKETYGVLDMGGASTEIAYVPNGEISINNKVTFHINNHKFMIYSHSYLGLGQDLARSQFLNNPLFFPKGYSLPDSSPAVPNYNLALKEISKLLDLHEVQKIEGISIERFIGISGYKYVTSTFPENSNRRQYSIPLLHKYGRLFFSKSWKQLQKEYYPGEYGYLYSDGFNNIFISEILTRYFGGNCTKKLRVEGGKDWTMGAAIYISQDNSI